MGTSGLVISPAGEGPTAQRAALPASTWALRPAPAGSSLCQVAAKSGLLAPRSAESGSYHSAAPARAGGAPWPVCASLGVPGTDNPTQNSEANNRTKATTHVTGKSGVLFRGR